MFWEPLFVDKAHGMLLTSSPCADIFIICSNISLADKVNLLVCTWSFLNPFKWEFFFKSLPGDITHSLQCLKTRGENLHGETNHPVVIFPSTSVV